MELNLKEVLNDLIAFAASLPDFAGISRNVKEYEAEYDDDNWTEKHPSCLVEITGTFPHSKDAQKNTATRRVEFLLFVGNKIKPKHPLEVASSVVEEFEAQEFVYEGITYFCNLLSMNFFAHKNSVKVYALKFVMSP